MIAMESQYINPKFPLWVHVIRYNTGVVVSQLVVDREGNARFKFKIIDLNFFHVNFLILLLIFYAFLFLNGWPKDSLGNTFYNQHKTTRSKPYNRLQGQTAR
jgi:hypothetical protein